MTEGTVAEVGIQYGTSPTSLDNSVSYTGEAPADFNLEVDGLTPGTIYYYRTYVKANGTGTGTLESTVKTFTGETKRFNFGTKIPATLEAPATKPDTPTKVSAAAHRAITTTASTQTTMPPYG